MIWQCFKEWRDRRCCHKGYHWRRATLYDGGIVLVTCTNCPWIDTTQRWYE